MACSIDQKATIGEDVGLRFTPEDIHVMRLNESEEDFDRRLDAYGEDENDAK